MNETKARAVSYKSKRNILDLTLDCASTGPHQRTKGNQIHPSMRSSGLDMMTHLSTFPFLQYLALFHKDLARTFKICVLSANSRSRTIHKLNKTSGKTVSWLF